MIDLNTYTREQLISMIETLGFDVNFGMFQRDYAIRAIDGKSGEVMFLDLDNFKSLNAEHGYEATNKMVREAFAELTQNNRYVVFRWFSGDEIVIFAGKGIRAFEVKRVRSKIAFTGAIGTVNGDLVNVVNTLSVKVMRAKKTGQKGIIVESD